MKNEIGKLYLVATPIGNLDDMSFRAVKTLKEVDLIAAEDTRHSKILIDHYEISVPLTSYHEHNKYDKANILIEKLLNGENIALITDAGTPAISDPGEVLVKMAKERGIEVTSVPGPSAVITALSMSGFPARRFAFEGFVPQDKKEKEVVMESLANEERTIICYEAPHRLKKTLAELEEALGDRRICICRELTKVHEEAVWMTIKTAIEYYGENEPKGEYVLIIEGICHEDVVLGKVSEWNKLSLKEHLQIYLDKGIDKKEAMKLMANDRGVSKREIYQGLLEK